MTGQLQSASVPVCSTVSVPSPSRPTQKLEKVFAAVQVTAGSDQDADTLVNVPAPPADTYPAQFSLVMAAAFAAFRCATGPAADLPLRGSVNIAWPGRRLRNYPQIPWALREAGMDRDVLDVIEREIDQEVRAGFPGIAVRQAVLLQYGDDPEIGPGGYLGS
jgi:hypothetical protein